MGGLGWSPKDPRCSHWNGHQLRVGRSVAQLPEDRRHGVREAENCDIDRSTHESRHVDLVI